MLRTSWLTVLVLALLTGCAQPTPEQSVIDDAAAAIGGRDRIAGIKSLSLEGEGTQGNLGQDMRPEATGQTFTVTKFTRTVDTANGRVHTEQTRTPTFAYFQGQAPQTQVQALDGSIAFNVAPNGAATRASELVAKDRRADYYQHPITILRAALDPAAKVTNAKDGNGERSVEITTADGVQLALTIDGSNLPSAVSTKTSNANLGDVVIETSFADYQTVNGVKLPARITTTTDEIQTAQLRLSKQTIDGQIGDLAAPAAVASAAAPAPPAPTVTAEQVAPGVWWLAGQSHHSALIEFSDHLMLIEAPQSEARTMAVIAKARELRPGKPLTQIVNSHHHFDHSAGIRAAVAEGLQVITHSGNRSYFEHVTTRAFTIAPDTLAKRPKDLNIDTVDDEKVIEDKTMTVALYLIAGSPHSDTMLMAYLPKERILIEADAFSPGSPIQPYAPNLLENVHKRNLKIDRIVPLHGTIAPFSELAKTATPSTH